MEYHLRKSLFKLSELKPKEYFVLPGIVDSIPGSSEPVRIKCDMELTPTYWGTLSKQGNFIPETTYIGMYPERYNEYEIIESKINSSTPQLNIEEEAILVVTSDWDQNYQHFLLETLPRIHSIVLSAAIDIPILLADYPHIREIASILYPHIKFYFIKPGTSVSKKLNVITVSFVQKNMSVINAAGRSVLRELQNKVLPIAEKISANGDNNDSRIFIGRKNSALNSGASRYMINQDQFNDELINQGYSLVTFEGLSLVEKSIKVFNAREIITPVGANIMNLIFAVNANTLYLIPHNLAFWRPEWFMEFVQIICPNLKNAKIVNCVEIHDGLHPKNRPFTVNIEKLVSEIS